MQEGVIILYLIIPWIERQIFFFFLAIKYSRLILKILPIFIMTVETKQRRFCKHFLHILHCDRNMTC